MYNKRDNFKFNFILIKLRLIIIITIIKGFLFYNYKKSLKYINIFKNKFFYNNKLIKSYFILAVPFYIIKKVNKGVT